MLYSRKTIIPMRCPHNDRNTSTEPIVPLRRIRKLCRARETPGALGLNDIFILALFLKLASGYENMNDTLF